MTTRPGSMSAKQGFTDNKSQWPHVYCSVSCSLHLYRKNRHPAHHDDTFDTDLTGPNLVHQRCLKPGFVFWSHYAGLNCRSPSVGRFEVPCRNGATRRQLRSASSAIKLSPIVIPDPFHGGRQAHGGIVELRNLHLRRRTADAAEREPILAKAMVAVDQATQMLRRLLCVAC